MTVHDFDQVVTCDCDDTLVMWSDQCYMPHEGAIEIEDPYNQSIVYLTPHREHVELMKKYKARGFLTIVWSAGGVKWAEAVVKALGMQDFTDLVLTKPNRYVDDLPCENWMGNRVFIPKR